MTGCPIMSDAKELRIQYPDSFLLEYVEKCKDGEIIIGHELMAMLDILINDMDDPQY